MSAAEDQEIEVPTALAASHARYDGEQGRRWITALPALAADVLERWQLRRDGPATHGAVALVLPVRRADGTRAALKLQPVNDETRGEVEALRCWTGRGVVAVLEEDAASGTMLLQWLDPARTLASVPDDLAAVRVIAELLRRMHEVRAPGSMRRLSDLAPVMLERVPRMLPLLAEPEERRLLEVGAALVQDLLGSPVPDRLLHWDLHYDNVLANDPWDDREPWLAIDPKPLAGDPGFDLLPALWNRWDDVVATGDVHRAVLRRFDLMREVLGLDPDRARGWTLARVVQEATWDLGRFGGHSLQPSHRSIAEALVSRSG